MGSMTPVEFRRITDRDGGRCLHCGTTETLVPNHRQNRGMGGSKDREIPSNVVTLCSRLNGLIESSADHARMATDYGWKLPSWLECPYAHPVYDANTQRWYYLDNFYHRTPVDELKEWPKP